MDNQNEQNNRQTALAMTKAIGYTENNGAPDPNNLKAGQSGEMKSVFQFEPATWQKDSQEVFGKPVAMTPDTETAVVASLAYKALNNGMKPEQFFSTWNAGDNEPNAYTGKFSDGSPSIGKNKEGVAFNVPAYVDKAMGYLNEFNHPTTPPPSSQSQGLPGLISKAFAGKKNQSG